MKIDAGEAAALAAVVQRDLEAIASIEAHAGRLPDSSLRRH
jgi:hypothetical protein